MTDAPAVLLDVTDGVAELTLNRPERMNSWGVDIANALFDALRKLDADDAVRAIVVTGKGRAFCAGADLSRRRAQRDGAPPPPAPAERVPVVYGWQLRKPIIAAIHGAAVGVGMTLPLTFDFRIAADDAKLGFVFVSRGLVPELGSTWILPRLVGLSRASELLMSGRILLGAEAAAIGLVNEAVPQDEVLPRARALAHRIATDAAPVSVALTKRLIWESLAIDDPAVAAAREQTLFRHSAGQPDAQEGIRAFLEKRPAQWTGKPSTEMPPSEPLDGVARPPARDR
jgi:enoyl-CoA hydratase/carnithine racemase